MMSSGHEKLARIDNQRNCQENISKFAVSTVPADDDLAPLRAGVAGYSDDKMCLVYI